MDDAHVGIAAFHLGNHVQGSRFTQVIGKTVHVLVPAADFIEALGSVGKTGHAYIQAAGILLPAAGQVLQLVQFLQDDPAVGQDPLTVHGQTGSLAGAAEQGHAHFSFQLFDDVAELGLGNVHGFGGPGNGAVLGHGGKISKIVGIHGNLPGWQRLFYKHIS